MIKKKTLVVGASLNSDRYAYRAITSLRHNGHPVLAWGLKKGIVADVLVETDLEDLLKRETAIDTVTVYLGARNQEVLGKILDYQKPSRFIFNPGAENPSFMNLIESHGIEVLEACTLVMLASKTY